MISLNDVVDSGLKIKGYVERDLVSVLAGYDLQAAALALKEVSRAEDKHAALWSVLNHLRAAEVKYESQIARPGSRDWAHITLYVIAIRSVIFRYLDEESLVKQCFERSVELAEMQRQVIYSGSFQTRQLISLYNPYYWGKSVLRKSSRIQKDAYSLNLKSFWSRMGYDASGRLLEIAFELTEAD